MSIAPSEFSRPVNRDRIGKATIGHSIAADEGERAALAKRFGLVALDRLEADYDLTDEDGGVVARGRVRASLSQPCVASGEPVPETIDAPFSLRFVEEGDATVEELEVDAEDQDMIGYDGLIVDMGEAVAQTMALTMEPWPRAPNADAWLKDKGVLSEEDAGPFAALKALKDRG
jgi:uncharacterized metal-binding protein YceD (DUF177 family)